MQREISDLWKGMDGLPEGHNAESNQKQTTKVRASKGGAVILNEMAFAGPAGVAPDDIVAWVGMRLRQAVYLRHIANVDIVIH